MRTKKALKSSATPLSGVWCLTPHKRDRRQQRKKKVTEGEMMINKHKTDITENV
jgi:hypothetical protein